MGKFSASFLAMFLMSAVNIISAYRHLNCSNSNEGHIFIRNMNSIYLCKDRREEHIGCIFSESIDAKDLYGFDTTFLFETLNVEDHREYLFNVGKRNLPNCCALRSIESDDDHLKHYLESQRDLSNILRVAMGDEAVTISSNFIRLNSTINVTRPYNSICKMDSDPNKQIYAVHRSSLYKCNGDAFEMKNACAFPVNGSHAVRCAAKEDVEMLFNDEAELPITDPEFCCNTVAGVTNPDADEELQAKLKPCNSEDFI